MLGIASLLDGHDGFDECLLEDVVGNILVFYNVKNVGIDFLLMAFKQYVKSVVVVIGISCNQITVGEL